MPVYGRIVQLQKMVEVVSILESKQRRSVALYGYRAQGATASQIFWGPGNCLDLVLSTREINRGGANVYVLNGAEVIKGSAKAT